ncbi:NLR family member X1 [Larimichthys crocea]|uniref:Uncharacterized protein n=1 Tax=Larimichthys crocea TaxID=215358 RepID=A0ACD3Q5R5_LARCR|nr:NLR family member X1 [Larimichthys crocea]
MDYNTMKYFLNLTKGKILELDLTGTGVSYEALRDIEPLLLRCENLWLGENNLNMEAVQVIADVLQGSESLTCLGLGWSNIGDEELLTLSSAIRIKRKLQELWMEGNRVSDTGLLSLSDLTPNPLKKVVAIWNDQTDSETFYNDDSITVNFTDDETWESWGEWVIKRCEVSSNEKLVMVLHKVCNVPVHCLEAQWAKAFYKELSNLIERRIECCTEDDMCKKLKKFEGILKL